MEKVWIGLDIGGTKIMVAAVDSFGVEVARCKAETPPGLQDGLDLLERLITEVSANKVVAGIGAACGGPLDAEHAVVSPLHQPQWRDLPLGKIMQSRWRCPFSVGVDTNVAALGEYYIGKYTERSFLYVTLSTGMGGGFLLDGKIYRGKGHPEIGHQTINARTCHPERVSCECGGGFCLEALVSGNGIRRLYWKPAEELDDFEWDEVAYNLGQGLRNIAAILSPDIIVFGGGVAVGGGKKLLNSAEKYMQEGLKIVTPPELALSRLGYDTALRGACWLALNSNNK